MINFYFFYTAINTYTAVFIDNIVSRMEIGEITYLLARSIFGLFLFLL